MQTLGPLRPRFTELLKHTWLTKPFNLRAFSSTPPSDYSNQSRGGLPRFFSETLPSSKGGVIRVHGDEFWHTTEVLRLKTDNRSPSRAEATSLVSALTSTTKEPSGLIIVGPEGDFTEKEVNMITEAGATAVGVGPHRLRVETATIAILATLMLWSDSQ